MKTKLFRVGRSSVSVILAVMMLLSTMLVGTVSTVNAVDLSKVSKVYVDANVAKYNASSTMSNNKPTNAYAFSGKSGVYTYTDENDNGTNSWRGASLKSEGNGIYSVLVSNDATGIIFNSSTNTGNQTGDLTLPDNWKTTPMIYRGDGSTGGDGWVQYSEPSLTYTVNFGVSGGNGALNAGSVTSGSSVDAGTKVTFTAAPNTGYEVEGWYSDSACTNKIDAAGTAETYEVTVNANTEVYVKFKEVSFTDKYSIHVKLAENISTYSFSLWAYGDPNETNAYGYSKWDSKETFTISDNEWHSYTFKNDITNWNLIIVNDGTEVSYKNGYNTDLWITVKGTNQYEVSSIAPTSTYKVTYGVNGGNGTLSAEGVTSGSSVDQGTKVTFTAAPADGYEVEGWYSNADCTTAIADATGTTYTTTVTADTTVYAKFVAIDYNVTYKADGEGYTVSNMSATSAHIGDTIVFTVTPKSGYKIDSVKANDTDAVKGEDGKYTFTMPAKNVAISVKASLVSYNINNGGDDKLTYTVDGKSVDTANVGQVVTVSCTKEGYTLTSITVKDENGKDVAVDGLTFTMPASAVTVTPAFKVNNHSVIYDDTVTGLDSVGVVASANYNTPVAVTVTAKSGYTVTGITVKETSGDRRVDVTTTADKYQFTMPDYDVTITPVIVVAEIGAPTVEFYGGAGASTSNISANQLYPITAEATSAENSKIQSAVVEAVGDNASDCTITKTETGYNFISMVEGTFTIKYTVVAVSTLDSSKTSTVEKTITITTAFTETQKAYTELAAYYKTVNNPAESDYSADAYKTLTAKLAEAKALVDSGLPASSNTDTEKYTKAKTELENAVADKLMNFYIKGRFRIKNSSGSYVTIDESHPTSVNEDFKFTSQGNGLYSLDTGCTLSELSESITGSTGHQYFFVYNSDNSTRYETSGSPEDANGRDNALDLYSTTSTSSGTRFNSTDTSGTVTLWVDTNDSTYKFYHTVTVEPKYALSGEVGNPKWDEYDAKYLVNTPVEGKSTVFSTQLVNDSDTSTKKFRLVDSGNVSYSVNGGADLTKYSESSPLSLSAKITGGSNDLYILKGKYTLFVDQSGLTPKVWVEPVIDTKNVTFSITGDGTGAVSINKTNVKDTDVQPVEINSKYTITVNPADDSYVESFKVGDETVTGNTYNGTMPNEDVDVTVVLSKKSLHAVQVNYDDGGKAEADITTAYSGQKVTITVTADNDHVFDGISVKTNSEPQSTIDCPQNTDGTYSFVMPDDDVNVYAKFRAKETYTVKVSSQNQELGSASINGSDALTTNVTEGDTVTIKATPNESNTFVQWTISGKYEIKDSKTVNDPEITLVVNGDIEASASFTETAPYKVAYGSKGTFIDMNPTRYEGIYVSTATLASSPNSDSNSDAHFAIYDVTENKYSYVKSNGYYWLTDSHLTKQMAEGSGDAWVDSYNDASNNGILNNACSSAKYVIFDANTNTITLTDDPAYGTNATLYAKKGTYYKEGVTSEYADSTIAKGLDTIATTPCNTYSVPFDSSVNIQTTLNSKYKDAGYYVAAYSVNGRSYPASALDADKGIYQANITVTEELAQNGVIEVTPVYYNRNIEKNGDYITFYVDFDQAEDDWGSTISVDAYCYKNGDQSKPDHLFGSYPGQPMVRDGRYYVINVPKYRYYIDDSGTLVKDSQSPVSGVTLNNYYFDSVHANLVPIKRNMQTYDFSDFVELANLDGVKTIMFQNQFYNADNKEAKRNMNVVYGVDTDADPAKANTSITDIANANVNTWNDFTDYYGRDTDALGNILTDDQKENDCLYIISTGSFNSTDYSTKGEWVTIWNVYDHNGKLVTYGTPADFLDPTTHQYAALNTADYLGKPVKISYEKGQSYSNNTSRSDGRWYYSKLGQEFTSDVAIEYKTQDLEDYIDDIDSNASDNTGFVGTTTKAIATINDATTAVFSSVTESAHLNIKVANGWRFDGWYIKQGSKYTKIGDNYTDISADVLMSNSYHIIARISEIPSGTLELDHTAYTGTDPASHTGTGFYYISAILYDQTGAVKKTYIETQNKISIEDYSATDTLKITLRTVCHGDNTIYALYEGENGGYSEIGDEDYRGLSTLSYTFTVPAGSLFRDDKLVVNALNYYSDIVKVGGTCDITYKYYDRFNVEGEGNMVSYVARNIELSTEEIQNGYQPSDETITKYAPRIDTMYVDTKWLLTEESKVDKGKSQATVIATQTNKTCRVYHPTLNSNGYYTDMDDPDPYVVEFNSLLINEDGSFILTAPEKSADGKMSFAYWDVYRVDENGKKTELVTKCYERNFGLRVMADYYIEPVYETEVPSLTANINSPVMNREVYGESTAATDKIYVDLLTAFTSTAIPTFKENTTDLTVECGVFVVRNNTTTLTEEERNALVASAQNGSADTTSEILKNHMMSADTSNALLENLNALAKDSSVKNNANTTYDIGDENFRVTKYVFDNNKLTNKNRIDKVIRYTNNSANQDYIFTAYAYVVIKNANGEVSEMVISDAQYYNICYVGNKA